MPYAPLLLPLVLVREVNDIFTLTEAELAEQRASLSELQAAVEQWVETAYRLFRQHPHWRDEYFVDPDERIGTLVDFFTGEVFPAVEDGSEQAFQGLATRFAGLGRRHASFGMSQDLISSAAMVFPTAMNFVLGARWPGNAWQRFFEQAVVIMVTAAADVRRPARV